ncbi:enoyl-CoA hydratase-related protein [Rhodococcus sp. HNM0569]|uniref:enoyl-CoA hydratase-related protein n=1 Tax=Rhodococcus sp. HNM0569 TaxID=2716340 RepID=UPI00146C0591|nr:enoyl-CoA hydratase-related protein [Rhodococcus sp. HNM0569]NLU81712.1 enoyl-CoA hydratase [Rhodococcus sp. HNM0569]
MTDTRETDISTGAPGLVTELVDGVMRITIDRPHRMNALDLAHLRALGDVLLAAGDDPRVRVIVLAGAGRAFSTGADLAASAEAGGREAPPEEIMTIANRVVRAVVDAPVPVVAEVRGAAAGVGASLAVAADLTVAADDAYFLLAFVNIGLMPDGGATALIPAAIGRARAARMALLGERLPAADALAHGLIAEVVPAAELSAHVTALAERIARGPRQALESTKSALRAATLGQLEGAFTRESEGQCRLLVGPEFAEGAAAMLDKRPPVFPRHDGEPGPDATARANIR